MRKKVMLMSKIEIGQTQDVALICGTCYNVKPLKLKFSFDKPEDRRDVYINNLEIRTFCPRCAKTLKVKNRNHFMVDRRIAQSIAWLNFMGYDTEYSCGGHINFCIKEDKETGRTGPSYELDYPYIFFNKYARLPEDLIKALIFDAGFDEVGISLHEIINIKKHPERLEEVLNGKAYVFYFNKDNFDRRVKQIFEKDRKKPKYFPSDYLKKYEEADKYLENVNKKLTRVMRKYYVNHKD